MLEKEVVYGTVAAALTTHWVYNRWDPKRGLLPILALLIPPPLVLLTLGFSTLPAPLTLASCYALFGVALGASVVAYRLSPFHPLGKFPGPLQNKVSKFWGVYVISGGLQHVENKRLHDAYGPIVRTGPNELSICDAAAIPTVLGVNGLPKGQYYDARRDPNAPQNLLVMLGAGHTNRRRMWNRGMAPEALKEYAVPMQRRVELLVEQLEKRKGKKVDLVEWIRLWSFDFMADMAFGGGFDMLRAGSDADGIWANIKEHTKLVAWECLIPWSFTAFQYLPFLTRPALRLRAFGVSIATARVKRGATAKDLFYHLMDEAGHEKDKPALPDVVSDGALAIIAGSDTASTALVALFFFLLTRSEWMEVVRREVDVIAGGGEGDGEVLEACINETLRMCPPVPTNGPRTVPRGSGGRVVCNHFVPEGTQVYVPPYSVHRNPAHFSPQPDKWDPARWLPESSPLHKAFLASAPGEPFVLNKSAHIPFSFGPANCVGQKLAMVEIRAVASALVRTFNIKLEDGFRKEGWEMGLKDAFVTNIEVDLPVVVHPR